MIEIDLKLHRDAAGLIVGIACKIGDGAADQAAAPFHADPIQWWLGSFCSLSDATAWEEATSLYEHFRQFCRLAGLAEQEVPSQTAFGNRLSAMGVLGGTNHARRKKVRKGIRLRQGSRAVGQACAWPAAAPPADLFA